MASKWVPGQGFFLVQHSGPIDRAQNRKNLETLEIRLQEAEKKNWGFKSVKNEIRFE
ncbi:hypothetical protein C7437_1011052 [Psychrobacillus insolitus]|uniref:Uncharacterized protein n=1 Tax=Psychrobacillus insolitus TaxID=1461 RepID=A0A2W7MMC9_9BACI|nr:hypothetical protein [Psychrobacillus insolitus]PZX07930.1 hypothetical protein C7437_1011052 [Psychrobacillus insolitus]